MAKKAKRKWPKNPRWAVIVQWNPDSLSGSGPPDWAWINAPQERYGKARHPGGFYDTRAEAQALARNWRGNSDIVYARVVRVNVVEVKK